MNVVPKNKNTSKLFLVFLAGAVILLMLLIVYITMDRSKREQAYQASDLLIDQVRNVIDVNDLPFA